MKKHIPIWFLSAVIGLALLILGILQYRWIESISESERDRLEKMLNASSQSFTTAFTAMFDELNAQFYIPYNEEIETVEQMVYEALSVFRNSNNPDLIKEVYAIRFSKNMQPELLRFNSGSNVFEIAEWTPEIVQWAGKRGINVNSYNPAVIYFDFLPDFGPPTFFSVNMHVATFRNLETGNREDFFKRMLSDVSSNSEVHHVLFLELNDKVLKEQVFPNLYSTYFPDSFDEQFILELNYQDSASTNRYYSSGSGSSIINQPDVSVDLQRVNFSRFLFLDEKAGLASSSSIRLNVETLVVSKRDFSNSSSFSFDFSSVDSAASGFNSAQAGLVMRMGTQQGREKPQMKLWIGAKAGSIEALVRQAKWKNIATGFGVLLVLAAGGFLSIIMVYRSNKLAEQQMLFVAGVSHELKTPLSIIRSAAENMADGLIKNDERKEQYARLVLKEGRRLSEMVDQIMEFSGIQNGKNTLHFSSVDAGIYFEELLDELRLEAGEYGNPVNYSIAPNLGRIEIETASIKRCIQNVFMNALKFSGPSQPIDIRIYPHSSGQRPGINIDIQDRGIGIPDYEIKHIFSPFFRGQKPVSDQIKGNGIGLSIVKKIVEAHNGMVEAKSSPGKGSTFSIWIPSSPSH